MARETSIEIIAPDDLPLMRRLIEMFGTAFDEPHIYHDKPPSDGYLAGILGSPGFIAVAAVEDGAVVGGLTAYIFDKYEQDRREIYLYDLAVLESHRRRGIATAAIRTLCAEASRRGVAVVIVQTEHWNDAASAVYRKLGKEEKVLSYEIDLPGAGAAGGGPRVG